MSIPIVLDTSFLLAIIQRKLPLFDEVERLIEEPHFFVVMLQCVDELKEMASKQKKISPISRAALVLVAKKGAIIEKRFTGKPDDAMLAFCQVEKGILCTLDGALKNRAKRSGVKCIFPRGKASLALA